MNEQLFRKKSVDKVYSPEQLNEYIKVANPGVWMVLAVIIILLLGVVIWGCIGHLETTLSTVLVVDGGEAMLCVREGDIQKLSEGMSFSVDSLEYTITEIPDVPIRAGEMLSEYAAHAGGLTSEDWVYMVRVNCNLSDGIYKAEIVIERVSPISFILN